ncbi:MAG: hypothetical protein HEP71_03450 [Roseivirga sp.]|nr:hypothetical protein [Roseivirga sp.]
MKFFAMLLILGLMANLFSCESTPSFSYEDFDYSGFKFYDLPMGEYPVGFHSELHWDESRTFNGMDKRPLLIGMWYPASLSENSEQINYKDYLLADSQHDGVTVNDTTMTWLKGGFTAGAETFFSVEESEALRVMDLPVRAFDQTEVQSGKHPLLLYAASFNAGIHENSAIWEYLASHGYIIAAIASVGTDRPGMTPDSLGIAAQLADFQLLHNTITQRPYVDTDKVATSGFSWGGFATTLMGIEKEARLMISMDGSQTYFPQAVAQFQRIYDQPAKGAYMQLSQRGRADAQIKLDTMVYHWMGQSADAYLYRFKAMDHRDFGGSFQYLHAVSNDSAFRAGQAQFHAEVYSKGEKGEGYLKTAEMILQALNAYLMGNESDKSALNDQPDSLFSINRRHFNQ